MSDKHPPLIIGKPFSPEGKLLYSPMPHSVMALLGLQAGPKLLYARLLGYAGKSDRCYPSITRLSSDLSASQDQISRWLKNLEDRGLIFTIRHQRREAERVIILTCELVPSLRQEFIDANPDLGAIRNQDSFESGPIRNQNDSLILDSSGLDFGSVPVLILDPCHSHIRKKRSSKRSSKSFTPNPSAAGAAEGVGESPPTSVAVALLPTGRFPEWWEMWKSVMGSNHFHQALRAYAVVVTAELESAGFECTQSYLASRGDRNGGYNPENFLRDQARDGFMARWPAWKEPRDKNQQQRDNVNQGSKILRDQLRKKP